MDVAIIGGGPAGLAAALKCYELGIKDIAIFERDNTLGGILNQCIHNGFGLHWFGEELTGPEYAQRFIDEIEKKGIKYYLDTMVLDIDKDITIRAISPELGYIEQKAKACILAMGCRERTAGAIMIPGTRPAGVYTAGMVQRLTNLEGYMPGKEIVILGSGDIGLIMARRMTWEGAFVKMVLELQPYTSGLARNVHQCLTDNNIPLKLSHTITKIHGNERLTGVTVSQVDENYKPIKGTDEFVKCDTLLLSVGLIPENELSKKIDIEMDRITNGPVVDSLRQTSCKGFFACGNVLQVHDLVDFVSEEAELAAQGVKSYLDGTKDKYAKTSAGDGIRYIVPQKLTLDTPIDLYFRSDNIYKDGYIELLLNNKIIKRKKILKLAPSEMEKVKITESMLENIKENDEISIRYVKESK